MSGFASSSSRSNTLSFCYRCNCLLSSSFRSAWMSYWRPCSSSAFLASSRSCWTRRVDFSGRISARSQSGAMLHCVGGSASCSPLPWAGSVGPRWCFISNFRSLFRLPSVDEAWPEDLEIGSGAPPVSTSRSDGLLRSIEAPISACSRCRTSRAFLIFSLVATHCGGTMYWLRSFLGQGPHSGEHFQH